MINSRKTVQKYSHNLHQKRQTVCTHDGTVKKFSLAQKIILIVIALTALAVVVATIFALNFNRKYQIEAKITDLAQAYYEDYYYPNIFGNDEARAGDFLERFAESGLTSVSLRQLLLSTPGVSEEEQNFLRGYCDENITSVVYYPEPPYAHDSYRVEYDYSCNFE